MLLSWYEEYRTLSCLPLPSFQQLRSGTSKTVSDTFLTLYNTYLANDMPPTMQASAKAAMKQYDDGDLTAQQLADCMSAFYETVSDLQDASQKQKAWLSRMER